MREIVKESDPIGKFKKCETMEDGSYKITWENHSKEETFIIDSKKMEKLIKIFNALGRSFQRIMDLVAIKMSVVANPIVEEENNFLGE